MPSAYIITTIIFITTNIALLRNLCLIPDGCNDVSYSL